MQHRGRTHARLLCSAAAVSLMLGGAARAQDAAAPAMQFNIPPQPLSSALNAFGEQSHSAVLFKPGVADAKMSAGLVKVADAETALRELLAGAGLTYERQGSAFVIEDPQGSSAGGGAETNVVQELVVTAQKKSENIQVVPIAISAFSQQDLTTRQVAGGPDLMTQVPNMTFTKTNFSSYSIQIRGIGTQAISATTDAAVAVAFNNSPFIRNRFFEQEFYDLERIEVLRGPQGTLYGRNATAGVVNIISAKPTFQYDAKASADIANFSSRRLEGMINMPLVEDKVALRVAGAWTKRDGYATNQITGSPIDGRDLWSTRTSLRIEPNDRFRANLIWEHFQENDDRLRSGKQLCKKDVVSQVGNITDIPYYAPLPNNGQLLAPWAGVQASLSQGCERNSLYSPDSFQTPTGLMLPYYVPLGAIGLPIALRDPYVSTVQSQDLRVIESTVDPKYAAKSDLGELQVSFDLTDKLTLSLETAYNADTVYSLEDYNRFNTASGAWSAPSPNERPGLLTAGPNGGVFCDPQLGCSDRLVAVDISSAKSRQFSQEFRLSSSFAGRFNFSLGANFLRYDTEDKYYVFINALTLESAGSFSSGVNGPYIGGVSDNSECQPNGLAPGDPNNGVYPVTGCVYIDPNPIGSVNDQGHNYFLSDNPYKLISYAVFGEAYYNITDNLKLTAGARWTVDKKEAPRIPSWILASRSVGYPVAEVIRQNWSEPTGRLAIDWKPDLGFTDQTLLYASYAHGYKAGGANPPGYVRVFYAGSDDAQTSNQISATRPKTFDPEFVDAFELGSKNTFADGKATLNVAAFYYDYKGYQVSEIVDRSAFNRNFDATVWGVEIESDWRPLKNLRLGLKGGYEKTRIADGEQAIDLMDRTAGDPNWTVLRPFPTFASSCILPTILFAHSGPDLGFGTVPGLYGLGGVGGGNPGGCEIAYLQGLDPVTQQPYVKDPQTGSGTMYYWDPGTYHGWDPKTAPNHGEGIFKQLGGNELPNAPHWTATLTGDYTIPLAYDWTATLHTDVHWQSQSWWRVFNDHEYDKLHPYFTMNLAAIFKNERAGWTAMAYVKNVTDETAITGAFLNSDDTGLTTNVFLTEPRLYGLRVTKDWDGVGPWWMGVGADHKPGEPYPLTVELGGQVQRWHAPYETLEPSFGSQFVGGAHTLGAVQHHDLDWGDGRNLKLIYRPEGGAWSVSADLRFGRTNGGDARAHGEKKLAPVCWYSRAADGSCPYAYFATPTDLSDSTASNREEYQLVDFAIGREVGFGGLSRSNLSLGLRYAQFKSTTDIHTEGVPDAYIPEGFFSDKYLAAHHHRDKATLEGSRGFKGAGPILSWEASKRLLGDQEVGHLDADWSLAGGALFGKHRNSLTGTEDSSYYQAFGFYAGYNIFTEPVSVAPTKHVNERRTKSATVPLVDLSVGVSYEIQRLKLSTGYRWERYFNALDAGFQTHKNYDRTIDGPYFKVSVGFGG